MIGAPKYKKTLYYAHNLLKRLVPHSLYRAQLERLITQLSEEELEIAKERVAYYMGWERSFELGPHATSIAEIKMPKRNKPYYFDVMDSAKYFDPKLRGHYIYGDNVTIPEFPSFTKSRPLIEQNENAVLLKLNRVRHFNFVKNDKLSFGDKKNILVSRGKVHASQPHRVKFMELYHGHNMCNVGKTNDNELNANWKVDRLSVKEQLQYKFVLSLEGNDVASNLKWIMSSNSLAVMPKPKFETWFMEGKLLPDVHYVCIADDYSDLEEKLQFYIDHPEKAETIISNSRNHIAQFKNKKLEKVISLLVMRKYFRLSGQI